jgi:hypothetical protein
VTDDLFAEARELEDPDLPVVQRHITVSSRGHSVTVELPEGCTRDEADKLLRKALRDEVIRRERRPRH